ncbi:hypothetical protein M513_06318 [Trichuris suis]|uniref:Uncharacterized protein n=1 Tax=Trichuris suis TaxID=68888 RepID=A0A085M6I1_9BILA|nr:hypothetical protein M513_06318 [Trichuris suis]
MAAVSPNIRSRIYIDFFGPFQGKTFLILLLTPSLKWVEVNAASTVPTMAAVSVLRTICSTHELWLVTLGEQLRTIARIGEMLKYLSFHDFLDKGICAIP